jgi:hypothetical protein
MTDSTARRTKTVQYRRTAACPHCSGTINVEEPWKKWIRNNPHLDSMEHGLSLMDTDMWVHKFGQRRTRVPGWDRDIQYLMKIEVKTNGADITAAQRDDINLIDNLLRTKPWKEHRVNGQLVPGHPQNVREVFSKRAGKKIRVICHGYHILRMSHETPGCSEWLLWDGREVTKEQVVRILRYELDPDSLRPLEHREHKKLLENQPTLFNPDLETA